MGEGVQIWDFRNLERPVTKCVWNVAPSGDILNPIVNSVRFIPGQKMVLAGCSDAEVSVKCFDSQNGEILDEFHRVQGNCFSLDVARDGQLACLGDSNGSVHFESINYSF